jgi:streptogramin lyase
VNQEHGHTRKFIRFLHHASRIPLARFDPDTREIKEYAVIPGGKPYSPPFPSPYSLAVDDKNQIVWTNDFNSSRIYRLDMKTGQSTEFLMPAPYEVRDLTVDETADRQRSGFPCTARRPGW